MHVSTVIHSACPASLTFIDLNTLKTFCGVQIIKLILQFLNCLITSSPMYKYSPEHLVVEFHNLEFVSVSDSKFPSSVINPTVHDLENLIITYLIIIFPA
jgi:hypothetical protein